MQFNYIRSLVFFTTLVCFFNCKNEHNEPENKIEQSSTKQEQIKNLFKYVDASASGVNFDNSIRDSLEFNIFYYEYNYNGGGVAIGDINSDGLADIYFSGTFVPNRLYVNLGNLKFKDVTEETGVTGGPGIKTGVSFIDINQDGLLDIYVCKSGKVFDDIYRKNVLYVNKGNLKFSEEAMAYGIADASYSTQAYWSDLDLDGDIDMYLVNHPIGWGKQDKLELAQDAKGNITVIKDTARYHISDRLYINENGRFKDRTKQFHVDNISFGLSAIIADVNDDGYPDIYVCNDYTAPDNLYINQRGKDFKDESLSYFSNISSSSMGCDMADFNNDGKLDLYVNDMMPEDMKRMKKNKNFVKNYDSHLMGKKFKYHDQFRYNSMQIKTDKNKFENLAFYTGTACTDWSWAVLGEDFDHNGSQDLFIANGYLKDVVDMDYSKYVLDSLKKHVSKQNFYGEWIKKVPEAKLTNYFYANNGQLQFDNVSNVWCDGRKSFSNGAAYGDLDNDGDLDLVVNNINDAAFVMQNTLQDKAKGHFVNINLKGGKLNNRGYGAELVAIGSDGSRTTKLFNPYRGYMSSVDQRVHFGSKNPIQAVEVKWPGGNSESFSITADGEITLELGKGKPFKGSKPSLTHLSQTLLPWKHRENEYIDFKREPLLHLKNSVEGPTIASADVDGDGFDDIFVGGGVDQVSTILTYSNGKWVGKPMADFVLDSSYEDVASCFSDIDNDGDQDLLVASGGYQFDKSSPQYALRLYTNDGTGKFTRNEGRLPDIRTNATSICAADFDRDGDQDIFLGGGAMPNAYPEGDNSFYLENNSGKFIDKTNEKLPSNGLLSIVKDCVASDINKDGFIDLVIAGDWTPIRILLNDKVKFTDKTNDLGLQFSDGLWQDLLLDDVDDDGDVDILAGNLGQNSFFKASKEKPTCIYSSDFDGNGEHDAIMCTYFGNTSYPVHPLDKLFAHMTSLRKKFLRYAQYAGSTIDQIFAPEKLKEARIYNAYTFDSSIFYNEGGKFVRKPLPASAQLSMIKDMCIYNSDQGKKLIVAGNFWDTDFDFGKYDASHGAIFNLDKKGIFEVKTTLAANGNIRELELVCLKDKKVVIIGGNNEVLQSISGF